MPFKFLTAEAYNALSQKAAQHDKIVAALNAARADGYATELTATEAVEMLLNPDNSGTEALQSQIDQLTTANTTLQSDIESLTTERDTLQSRVQELEAATPGAPSATLNADGEPIAQTDSSEFLAFAKENAGDPMAMFERMKKEGLV